MRGVVAGNSQVEGFVTPRSQQGLPTIAEMVEGFLASGLQLMTRVGDFFCVARTEVVQVPAVSQGTHATPPRAASSQMRDSPSGASGPMALGDGNLATPTKSWTKTLKLLMPLFARTLSKPQPPALQHHGPDMRSEGPEPALADQIRLIVVQPQLECPLEARTINLSWIGASRAYECTIGEPSVLKLACAATCRRSTKGHPFR